MEINMLDMIYDWIKNIIIFLVLTTIITNLLGKSAYKKYINLITGMILLILVISPLFKLLNLEDSLDYFFSANYLLAETKEINVKLNEMEDKKIESIILEYKEKIKTQIETILESEDLYINSMTLTIDEENNSLTYGQIQNLDIIASYVRVKDEVKPKKVDKINIGKIKIGENNESEQENVREILTPNEINVKKRLSDFYNMNPDNINISIQE
jgi:stage III sporulation protein AF